MKISDSLATADLGDLVTFDDVNQQILFVDRVSHRLKVNQLYTFDRYNCGFMFWTLLLWLQVLKIQDGLLMKYTLCPFPQSSDINWLSLLTFDPVNRIVFWYNEFRKRLYMLTMTESVFTSSQDVIPTDSIQIDRIPSQMTIDSGKKVLYLDFVADVSHSHCRSTHLTNCPRVLKNWVELWFSKQGKIIDAQTRWPRC